MYACIADSTFSPLLPNFFSVYFVFVQAKICARWLFSPAVSHRETEQGDPDREIVGIRGVTRGDLVLAHNGSICLRTSCKPPARDIAEIFQIYSRRKFSSTYRKYCINRRDASLIIIVEIYLSHLLLTSFVRLILRGRFNS